MPACLTVATAVEEASPGREEVEHLGGARYCHVN